MPVFDCGKLGLELRNYKDAVYRMLSMQRRQYSGMVMANFQLDQINLSMKRSMIVLAMLLATSMVLSAQPPHAKAYGKRGHHHEYKGNHSQQFYYYPQYNVYYHPASKKYACYERGQWVWVATPPPGLVLRNASRYPFYFDDFDVWTFEPVRRQSRPSVQIQVNL